LSKRGCLLFDWGDTLMRDDPHASGPMCAWERVEALPHASGVLASLRSQWLIALATNAVDSNETDIRAALKRVDLDGLIDKIYCYRGIGHKKPADGFFQYVFNDLRLDCTQIVMIGDSFEKDVLGANQAGIRSIWLNTKSAESKTGTMYSTIHDLKDLPDALGVIQPGVPG
jgi:HAD superfamily hydrolase (TIGR01509 family)